MIIAWRFQDQSLLYLKICIHSQLWTDIYIYIYIYKNCYRSKNWVHYKIPSILQKYSCEIGLKRTTEKVANRENYIYSHWVFQAHLHSQESSRRFPWQLLRVQSERDCGEAGWQQHHWHQWLRHLQVRIYCSLKGHTNFCSGGWGNSK